MKTYENIAQLLQHLHVTTPTIHPDFHIFKFNDTSNIAVEALEPHYKNFFTIDFYAVNKSERKIGATTIKTLTNCIGFNSPLQLFSVKPFDGKPGYEGYSIIFSANFFHPSKHQYEIQHEFPYFKLNSCPFYKLNLTQQVIIKNIFDTIYAEQQHSDSHSVALIRAYLMVLLQQIKRITGVALSTVKLNRYQEITAHFEDLILKDESKSQSISEYAEILHITPIYLSECVKKATGLSAKKVWTNYMILKAKSILLQTTQSIEEIAFEMGFEEATNFIKFFKHNTGITPAAYRKLP